jgi:hypothetical protein
MSNAKPTRAGARAKTDDQRATEVDALAAKLADAVAVALSNPSDPKAAWTDVATYAGNVQRRARLLAGLGRGG